MDPIALNKLEASATGRALEALIKGQVVLDTFADFTTNLVREVLNTIVQSSMDQLEAYGELVASVSGSISDFEKRSFPNLPDDVVAYVNQHILPTFCAARTVAFTKTSTGTSTVLTDQKQAFIEHFAGIVATIGSTEKVIDDATVLNTTDNSIADENLRAFATAKFKKEIKANYDRLVAILKLGVQKVVITDGKINTRLTFHVAGSDTDALQSSQAQTDYSVVSRSFGGSLSGRGSLVGKIFKGVGTLNLGGNRSRYNSTVKVSVVNEQKTAVTALDVDIMGGVELKFRTDYFPSFDPTSP